jgi:hypothetical protein
MTEQILEHLAKAEGTKVHRLPTESDITAPYGIYRTQHSSAKIFEYIDQIANELGYHLNSNEWNQLTIDDINNNIDVEIVKELVSEFYDEYYYNIHIDMYPVESVVAVMSAYTLSPKNTIKSIQSTVNKFIDNEFTIGSKLVVDGAYGSKTELGLANVAGAVDINNTYGYLFEAYFISHMQLELAKLVASNPDKYISYLNGWNNRLENLLKVR